jgi:hypothetical protein
MDSSLRVQPIERLQNCFRPGSDSNVIGKIDPTDRSASIDQKFRRSRYVSVVLPSVWMQNTKLADHDRFGI